MRGFIANVATETLFDGDRLTTYVSDDGVTWTSIGPPPYLDDVDSYIGVQLVPFAGRLRAEGRLSEQHDDIRSWESTDGRTWQPSPPFEGGQVETPKTDFGWVAITWL